MVDAQDAEAGSRALAPAIRLGIDVGGTFTDIVGIGNAETGWRVRKVPSTPLTPNVAVLNAVDALLDGEGDVSVEFLGHGTTAGTNAFLTKSGTDTIRGASGHAVCSTTPKTAPVHTTTRTAIDEASGRVSAAKGV